MVNLKVISHKSILNKNYKKMKPFFVLFRVLSFQDHIHKIKVLSLLLSLPLSLLNVGSLGDRKCWAINWNMWMKERVGGTGVTGDPLSSSHPSYLSPRALNLLYSLIPPPQNSWLLFSRPDQPSTHTLLGPVMTCAINPPILSHPLSVTHTQFYWLP